MSLFQTPVLFLIFNRPDETEKVFEVIRKVTPKYLYIAADGPRSDMKGEPELCEKAKKIVTNIDWPCNLRTLYRKKNLGCKKAVSEAINWFFNYEEQGIILEDDCLPDISFFPYCEQLLEKYKNDESIISIGGTNLGYEFSNPHSYGFSRFMNMWGWATWRRCANVVDYDMKDWKKIVWKKAFLHKKIQNNFFEFDYNWLNIWFHYFNQTALGKMDTWDYQWIFTQLYYNRVSIFPEKNLIKNIGYSKTATHTFHPDHPVSQLFLQEIVFPLNHPINRKINGDYENNFIKKVWFVYRRASVYRIMRSNFLNKRIVSKIINLVRENRGNFFRK